MNSEELKQIREELRKHIAALKFKLAEMAEERRRRAEEWKLADLDDDEDWIYKTLKTYIWKRAKLIWQAVGGNFNEDMKEYDIDKYFKNKELNKKELDKLLKKEEE